MCSVSPRLARAGAVWGLHPGPLCEVCGSTLDPEAALGVVLDDGALQAGSGLWALSLTHLPYSNGSPRSN